MPSKKQDPAKPVTAREELEALLLAGLERGEPALVTDEDWERLRRQALASDEDYAGLAGRGRTGLRFAAMSGRKSRRD
jgi:hypothetical protein